MSEPGATWLHHWAYYFLHNYLNFGAQTAIGWTSRIAGFAYLYVVAQLSLALFSAERSREIALFRLSFFSAGGILLFFGYVENTPLALPFELLLVLFSLKVIRAPNWRNIATGGFALALAIFIHGRASFIAPAFALACVLPAGPFFMRLMRAIGGTLTVVSFLGIAVSSILVLDRQNVIGPLYGNITGGGNRNMFVPLETFASVGHWTELFSTMLIGVGFLFPVGIVGTLWRAVVKKDLLYLWLLGYMLCDVIFLSLWEFDFGCFIDWDLIFSGMLPFVMGIALVLASSAVPVIVSACAIAVTSVVTLAFGMIVNGVPFALNNTPTAGHRYDVLICQAPGLQRTFYQDSELTKLLSPAEADSPNHAWGQHSHPHPNDGKPVGGRLKGYLFIPSKGTRRVFLRSIGNVHLEIGGKVLYRRWSGLEWVVVLEREMQFTEEGWYPITIEFFTGAQNIPLELSIESRDSPVHIITDRELCH